MKKLAYLAALAITATLARLQAVSAELEACYARWEMLESQVAANEYMRQQD